MLRRVAGLPRRAARVVDALVQARRTKGEASLTACGGYGTPERVEVTGRVLLASTLIAPSATLSRWRNFRSAVRRFTSREVRGVTVRGTLGGVNAEGMSDAEGYFQLRFDLDGTLPGGWHDVHVTLPGRGADETVPVQVVRDPQFVVVSDLDDTVIVTGVTRLWRMALTVLLGNAHTRLPFPGVSALYRALERGPDGTANNPLFYVSSSPWNLHDMLWTFLQFRRIPLGPMFLRDWGWHVLRAGHGKHKLEALGRLFTSFPQARFVLIGDSGEQDPEIYREVIQRFPGRVLAVYIREVTGKNRRLEVLRLREELIGQGVELILARDSLAAAHHAMAVGLIEPGAVARIHESAAR